MKQNARFQAPAAASRIPVLAIDERQVRQAIERKEFVLHYQPQIDIATGGAVGLEALVRWNHPQQGLIFPDSFFSKIRELGMFEEFGWLIAERGLSEIRQFSDPSQRIPRLTLKISAEFLRDTEFPDALASMAKKYGVPAHKVAVEVSGRGTFMQMKSALDVLTRLRVKDVLLTVDDYGFGGVEIQQLHQISATELKIDRPFVQNMFASEHDRTIVQKIILIAHELDMKAVADGVETEQQLEFLCHNGCDYAQGFYFSHPLRPEGITEWLKIY